MTMQLVATAVDGAMLVEHDGHTDARGYFARTFCEQEFALAGIGMRVTQINVSRNPLRLTLRGMHYQADPHAEAKVVQCIRGRVFDVAVDLRPQSPTYLGWASLELSPQSGRAFYIPGGCAHGFLTLDDDSDLLYLMDAPYVPEAGRGVRWDDPAFGIEWPARPALLSPKDAQYADFGVARADLSLP